MIFLPEQQRVDKVDHAVVRRWYMQLLMLDAGGNLSLEDWVKLCGQCQLLRKWICSVWSTAEEDPKLQMSLWKPENLVNAVKLSGECGHQNPTATDREESADVEAAENGPRQGKGARMSTFILSWAKPLDQWRTSFSAGKSKGKRGIGKRVSTLISSMADKLRTSRKVESCDDSVLPVTGSPGAPAKSRIRGDNGGSKPRAKFKNQNSRASNLDIIISFQLYYILQRKWRFKSHEFIDNRQYAETEIMAQMSDDSNVTTDEKLSSEGCFYKMKTVQAMLSNVYEDIEGCFLQEQNYRWFIFKVLPCVTEADVQRYEDFIKQHPELRATYEEVSRPSTLIHPDELLAELRKPLLPQEEADALHDTFRQIDDSGKGTIGIDTLARTQGYEENFDYASYDLDGDSRLEFEDFLAICCPPTHHTVSTIWHLVIKKMRQKLATHRADISQHLEIHGRRDPLDFEEDVKLPTLPEHGHCQLRALYKQWVDSDDPSSYAVRAMNGFLQCLKETGGREDWCEHKGRLTFDEFSFFSCPEEYKRHPPDGKYSNRKRKGLTSKATIMQIAKDQLPAEANGKQVAKANFDRTS